MKYILMTLSHFIMLNASIGANAVIWQRELECDPNSSCRPYAMVVDSLSNKLTILGTSRRRGERDAELCLWQIDPNQKAMYRNPQGLLSQYGLLMVEPFGIRATVNSDTGDIVRLNMNDAANISLSFTDKNMQTHDTTLSLKQKHSEPSLFCDMTSYHNESLFLVGKYGEDGIVVKTDIVGNVIWERISDFKQVDILSSVACGSDGVGIYVTGLSVETSSKSSFTGPATDCLLRYNVNGELQAKDFFVGGMAPWPSSLPKVVCLSSGVVLVVYDKTSNAAGTKLSVRAYTPTIELMYEKQVLETKENDPLARFDICTIPENRFVLVAKINNWDLRIYEYEGDGTLLRTVKLDGEIGAGNVYADYLADRVFVTFATRSKDNKNGIKIKVLALEP